MDGRELVVPGGIWLKQRGRGRQFADGRKRWLRRRGETPVRKESEEKGMGGESKETSMVKTMVKMELGRAFSSTGFRAACGITLAMLVGGVYFELIYYQSFRDSKSWLDMYLRSLVYGDSTLTLFYPIVAMIPFGLCYRKERDSGYRKLYLLKTSRRSYLWTKLLATASSAFGALLAPNLLWMLVCSFLWGEGDSIHTERHLIHLGLWIYDNLPACYALLYALHAAVLGAIFAVVGLGVSAVVRNRYLALFVPFGYCLFSATILQSFFKLGGLSAFYLLPAQTYVYESHSGSLGFWMIPLYEAALLAVGLALYFGGDYLADRA